MIQYMAMLRTHIFDAARNLVAFDGGMSAHGFSPIGSPRTVTEILYYVALGHHASRWTSPWADSDAHESAWHQAGGGALT